MIPDREQHAIALALNTAQRWFGRGSVVDDDDILGAAMLGAAKALRRFDPSRGVAFTSYAITLIRGEIQEELRRWDHLERSLRHKARAEQQVTGELPAWAAAPVSLADVILREGEWGHFDIDLQETIADPDQDPEALALARIAAEEWRRIIGRLPAQERRLIEWRYYEEESSVDALAPELGCSKTRVHQLHRGVRARLRQWIEEGVVALP